MKRYIAVRIQKRLVKLDAEQVRIRDAKDREQALRSAYNNHREN